MRVGACCILRQLLSFNQHLNVLWLHSSVEAESRAREIVRIVNEHPYPAQPLRPTLRRAIPKAVLSSSSLVEEVLGGLFGAHGNGLKAYELFRYCLDCNDVYIPSSDAFEKTLHILARMRYFGKAWELLERVKQLHPSLLTLKSMSILLSKIAKFKSYEATLEAFERMQVDIFTGKRFTTDEFNVLLRAFCTQRKMKEAKSVFNKMHSQFPPNTKTMNILLLGFKDSGDITAVELFYHDMVRRGFKPNMVTYHIRIDAYCKRRRFGDALMILQEMESAGYSATLETLTTLIHGAGIVGNTSMAKQLFEDITKRNLQPDTGAYNALMSSLIRSRDVTSAAALMDEMEKHSIDHDNMTYHNMFLGMMKSSGIHGVSALYSKMVTKNFIPKSRTVVMLMKFFCQNGRLDLGLDMWNYLTNKGQCPHSHALDLLVTGLCARGRVEESFDCSKQSLIRGRLVSDGTFQLLQRALVDVGEIGRLEELKHMIVKLKSLLPPCGLTSL